MKTKILIEKNITLKKEFKRLDIFEMLIKRTLERNMNKWIQKTNIKNSQSLR
jgi:hypothetical protein